MTPEEKQAEIQALLGGLAKKIETLQTLPEQFRLHKADIGHALARLDMLESTAGRLDAIMPNNGAGAENKVMANLLWFKALQTDEAKAALALVKQVPKVRYAIGSFWPERFTPGMEAKTTITSAAVGSSTPGILIPARDPVYVPAARRALRIRDVLRSRRITSNAAEWIKENVFSNAASPTVEATDKPESALSFSIASANVTTIASWVPIALQLLDDWPQLLEIVGDTLLYGTKLKEESEILSGDGLGVHLSGLTTNASAYSGGYDQVGDTRLDKLRRAKLELEVANESPSFVVLNPVDWALIETQKDETNGVNSGNYVAADPVGRVVTAPTVWGMPVITSNSLTSGKFLLGDGLQATIYDRQDAVLDVSREHAEFFTQNLAACRLEERMTLGIHRSGAFLYGSF